MSIMANYWAVRGNSVTLITLDSKDSDFYYLHPDINRIALNVMGDSANHWQAIINSGYRIKVLRREIKKANPDIVISFLDKMNVLTLLATFGLHVKVIVSERIDPAYYSVGRVWNRLRIMTYPFAHAIVTMTPTAGDWVVKNVRCRQLFVIPNPVVLPGGENKSGPSMAEIVGRGGKKTVVAMGRLHPQKGFDLLIRAFSKTGSVNSNWNLVIIGEGKERNALEQLAISQGVSDNVFFSGRIHEPFQLLKQADLFVFSSRFEGFGNALVEAMACGLPVISFDCPSGPNCIIRNEVDGLLVPPEDVQALTVAMNRMMTNEAERRRIASRAPEVLERFGLDEIMSMWESVIQGALEKTRQ